MIQDKECRERKEKKETNAGVPGRKINRTRTSIEEIFLQTSRINMQIDSKLQEIEYWRGFATKADVIFSAAGRGGGSKKNKSRVEECACKIADIQESLQNDMNELVRLREKVMSIIDRINKPEYRNLLVQRYICGKKWDEIAASMGYSYVHMVARLHPRALEIIKGIEIEVED